MKPLTIEQLKALEVGDWVWLIQLKNDYPYKKNKGSYYTVSTIEEQEINKDFFYCFESSILGRVFRYSNYGKTWFAYKNKEQAEVKGDIVEFKNILRDTKNYLLGSLNGAHSVDTVNRAFEQVERRLAELKGEL